MKKTKKIILGLILAFTLSINLLPGGPTTTTTYYGMPWDDGCYGPFYFLNGITK